MSTNKFQNFGEVLDIILNHLNIKQIELSKHYNIDKGSISTDRNTFMTRRRMLKYINFMEENDVSENFFLRGIYPVLNKEAKEEENIKTTILTLRAKIGKLEAVIIEKDSHIETLKEALSLALRSGYPGDDNN